MTDRMAFLVQNLSDLETNIVSVERINEYSKVNSEVCCEFGDPGETFVIYNNCNILIDFLFRLVGSSVSEDPQDHGQNVVTLSSKDTASDTDRA